MQWGKFNPICGCKVWIASLAFAMTTYLFEIDMLTASPCMVFQSGTVDFAASTPHFTTMKRSILCTCSIIIS